MHMKRLGDSGCEMEMKGLEECPASLGEDRVAQAGWIGNQLGWVRGGGLEKLPILVGDLGQWEPLDRFREGDILRRQQNNLRAGKFRTQRTSW